MKEKNTQPTWLKNRNNTKEEIGLDAKRDDDDDEYFEDSSTIGIFHSSHISYVQCVYNMCIMYIVYTTVMARNNIPVVQFPDHVTQMHQDRDRKFEIEYLVSKFPSFLS